MAGLLVDSRTATLSTGAEATQRRSLFHVDLRHKQFVDVSAVIVFGVGNGAFKSLLDDDGCFLLRERKNI